jgi:outer membrane protein TolC
MFRILLTLTLTACTFLTVNAQELDRYINIAVQNNIALKHTAIDVDRQQIKVKQSKSNSLPTLGFQSRYTRSGGGRAIEFATGDLVNPAYQNLNILNGINGTNLPSFPEIPNQQFTFLREKEQESKLSLVWPVFNKTISHNKHLQEEILDVEERDLDIKSIDLIHQVKVAYYNYLKSDQVIAIFDSSIALVKENIRMTTSLYRNDRVTKDQLLTAEAQLKSVEYQQEESRNNAKSAQAFFNYLLNRRYDAPILKDLLDDPQPEVISVEQAIGKALGTRLELKQLDSSIDIADRQMALSKSKFLPKINIVADYGVQGIDYNISADSDFYTGSAVLSWNIFNKSDRLATNEIVLDKQQRAVQKTDVEKQISLQVINAYNSLQTSIKSLELVQAEQSAAAEAFKLVQKKYQLGRANQVEFTDARVRLTGAQQKSVITRYDYWIRKAELDNAMGYSRGNR